MTTSLEYQVAAGIDDCRWHSTYFSATLNYLEFGRISGSQSNIALRFEGVTLPDDATITAAYLSLYVVGYIGTPSWAGIYAEDAANPTVITSRSDGNSRDKTSNYVAWNIPTANGWNNTDDISSVITELIGSYSYASGSAMQFIIICGAGTGSNYTNARSYDYGDPSQAAILHIEYSSGEVAVYPYYAYAQQM